jgi:EAL domain-containing protein (putative c-di-GMP-specific phosphodiesterase class I)
VLRVAYSGSGGRSTAVSNEIDNALGCALSSQFQPIFSLAHRRPVGYEGLIRARDANNQPVSPAELFRRAPRGAPRIDLDRRCRSLHVQNFVQQEQPDARGWLFLNVDPYVAIEGPRYGSFFAHMLHENGLAPHRVAVELIESQVMSEASLAAAVEYYREMGCVIVIDDFGAGYSNFDRIWRLRPNVVKIDREMTRRIGAEARVRYMFSGIVSVLHQAGALVCVEGIETEHEALCAIDAGADLVQGHLFASPAPSLVGEDHGRDLFARLFARFGEESMEYRVRRRESIQEYSAGLERAAGQLSRGTMHDFVAAMQPLLQLRCTQRCYLIGSDGTQLGANLEAERSGYGRDRRLEPMRPTAGTSWQAKPYFRRAAENPGQVQVCRPSLSVTGPRLCVTISLGCIVEGALVVACVDIDYEALAGDDLSFGVGVADRV